MNKIIITIPHSLCLPKNIKNKEEKENIIKKIKKYHLCDFISLDAGNDLEKQIKLHNTKVIKLESDTFRPICDLNRKRCRNNQYRINLTNKLTNDVFLLLDIHSYSPNYEWKKNNTWADIVILDDLLTKEIKGIKKSSTSLYNYLLVNNIKVFLLTGINNDIQDEAHENNINSFLIEYNERLDSKSINVINKFIVEWIFI